MILVELLIALGLLQVWGAKNPFHYDRWFQRWLTVLDSTNALAMRHWIHLLIAIGMPVLLVAVAWILTPSIVAFAVATVVLIYSLGRGEFGASHASYTEASNTDSWEDSLACARAQGVDTDHIPADDWNRLHESMLESTAYQGFERLFAVLFWFVLLGPAGALIYRLSYLYNQEYRRDVAEDWVWALEWPAARILGFSFAVTGNFVGCINRIKSLVFDWQIRTGQVLMQAALGALSVDSELVQSCDVTQTELFAIRRLYARTLWFWLTCIAIWVLLV